MDYETIGTRHLYRLDPAGVRDVRGLLDGFWDTVLDQFAQYAAEQGAKNRSTPSDES